MQKKVKITMDEYLQFVAMSTMLESVNRAISSDGCTIDTVKAIISGEKKGN